MHHPTTGSIKLNPGCPECRGSTIAMKGHGHSAQLYLCPRWKLPGHKSVVEITLQLERVWASIRTTGEVLVSSLNPIPELFHRRKSCKAPPTKAKKRNRPVATIPTSNGP